MTKALILGAGASYGTSQRIPTAARFGAELRNVRLEKGWSEEDYSKRYEDVLAAAKHLGHSREEWPLEDVWTCLDWRSKFGWSVRPRMTLGSHPTTERDPPTGILSNPWAAASPGIKTALLDVFGRRCDEIVKSPQDDWTLVRLIRGLERGDYLVSFNYDRVAERLAEGHIELRSASQSPIVRSALGSLVPFTDHIVLAKPHGSVSWDLFATQTNDDPNAPAIESVITEPGQMREPILLGAVPFKSELIWEIQKQSVPGVFRTVMQHWHVLCHAIAACDTLVVAGYSFPREDHHGRFLIEEAVRMRRSLARPGLRVELYEDHAAMGSVARTVTELFSPRELVFCGPVEGAQ